MLQLLVQCWALNTPRCHTGYDQTVLIICVDICISPLSIPANNLQVSVPYSQYRKELGENHLLRLTATLRVEDSFYIYFAQEEISICDPVLTIEVRSVYHSVTAVVRKQLS